MKIGGKIKGFAWWLVISSVSVAGLAAAADLRLVDAVEKQDQEAVRSLLNQHADVNAAQPDGATALAWAAHWDDLPTAELLIHAGAKVNAANNYGVTPLSLACVNASAEMVGKLLQAGADPNAARANGETPLMTCARTGSVAAIQLLLARHPDVDARENRRGQTALMWAVAEKHPEVARLLIEHGADVHARSKGGFTPLLFAAQQGDLDSARILLKAGAKVDDGNPKDGTALVVASSSGQEKLAIFLLDQGADPNAADANGMTPLHYVFFKGLTIITSIKNNYLTAYLNRPNMLELAKALLAHGANVNARIAKAVQMFHSNCECGINVAGATPFLLAAGSDDVAAMRLLAAGGADPLLATNDNVTPLMAAAGIGRVDDPKDDEKKLELDVVKVAIEMGNDVNGTNYKGRTALHIVAYTGNDEIVQYLVEKGGQVNLRDKIGQTPWTIAEHIIPDSAIGAEKIHTAHKSTAQLLLKLGARRLTIEDFPPAEATAATQPPTVPAGQD